MQSIGFHKIGNGSFGNGIYEVSDLFPRNVLKDKNGVLYVVDANVKDVSPLLHVTQKKTLEEKTN
jgi:hypothetical protein